MKHTSMKSLYNLNGLKSLIKCFKNLKKRSFIDLILTNKPNFFSIVLSLVLASDFQLLTVSELKVRFPKEKPKIITYR